MREQYGGAPSDHQSRFSIARDKIDRRARRRRSRPRRGMDGSQAGSRPAGSHLPRMQRYGGRILAVMGLALLVFGLVLQLVSHRYVAQLVLAAVVTVAGAVMSVSVPRQMRHNVERALALNKEDGAVR